MSCHSTCSYSKTAPSLSGTSDTLDKGVFPLGLGVGFCGLRKTTARHKKIKIKNKTQTQIK